MSDDASLAAANADVAHRIAIIGDRFMLPERFEAAIAAVIDDPPPMRSMANGWPDEDMRHGYAVDGLEGLKEYIGDPDEIVEFIGDADLLINHLAPVSAGMFERLPNLKLIAVSRGGPVNIDMAAARANGTLVVNTPGRNAGAVAEFTIGAILTETRRIRAGHESLRQGVWRGDLYRADRTGRQLSEMTVGVVGYGEIGKRLVKLLTPFGCTILVHDPYQQLSATDRVAGVREASLHSLLERSDVVTLHPRVTGETRHLIDRDALVRMKPDAILVNTARGPLVDYDALLEALQRGTIGGAMLETFDHEPVAADSPLLQLDNVTLTPHIAGASVYTIDKASRMIAEEVRRYLAGEPPLNPC